MSLDVYFQRERIGTLFPAGEGDYRFAYDPSAVERFGSGTQLLSMALPVRPEPFSDEATRAFVDGLLPEGRLRARLARRLELDPANGYGLLAELGRDCAGAVSFVPGGQAVRPADGSDPWLRPEELAELVAGRPDTALLEPSSGARTRFCLPGIHPKLALVHDEAGGRWGRPDADRPSTHVVKPETGEFPDLVANELFCTAVARCADLPVVATEAATIAGRPCLVSRRYDRRAGERGVERVHQEDFCQALGISPEDPDGPGFAESCGLLKAAGRASDVPVLLSAAFFNYSLGNGDAHGRNFALLRGERGARLAPLHDLASSAVYDAPTHSGMVIAEDYDETVFLIELAHMSEECGFDFEDFRRLAGMMAAKIGDCLGPVAERAREEGWHAPVVDRIVEMAAERAFGLSAEVEF